MTSAASLALGDRIRLNEGADPVEIIAIWHQSSEPVVHFRLQGGPGTEAFEVEIDRDDEVVKVA